MGSPTSDDEVNTLAKNLLKELPSKDFPTYKYFSSSCSSSGGCAEELAYAYHNLDNADHLDGTQAITLQIASPGCINSWFEQGVVELIGMFQTVVGIHGQSWGRKAA